MLRPTVYVALMLYVTVGLFTPMHGADHDDWASVSIKTRLKNIPQALTGMFTKKQHTDSNVKQDKAMHVIDDDFDAWTPVDKKARFAKIVAGLVAVYVAHKLVRYYRIPIAQPVQQAPYVATLGGVVFYDEKKAVVPYWAYEHAGSKLGEIAYELLSTSEDIQRQLTESKNGEQKEALQRELDFRQELAQHVTYQAS